MNNWRIVGIIYDELLPELLSLNIYELMKRTYGIKDRFILIRTFKNLGDNETLC
jgi:hypothetical protein